MYNFIITCIQDSNLVGWLQPAVIAAIIAALVSIPGIVLSFQSIKVQRLKSERDEIYKKLNEFYGSIRLQLKNSRVIYDVLPKSITKRSNIENFRTLPFNLDGKKFNNTEKTLFGYSGSFCATLKD
jgi:hypothetical protein